MTNLAITKFKTSASYNRNDEVEIIFSIEIPEDRNSVLDLIKTIAEKVNELSPKLTITTTTT